MLDFTNPKTPQQLASRLNGLGLVKGGADESVEPLEIEAIHTKYGRKPLTIIIEPSDLSINNNIDIKSSGATINQYGRMDPLQNYSSTSRSLRINFKMIKSEVYNGKDAVSNNTLTANLLQQMMYPSYVKTGNQNTAVIKTPPYFRIKYGDIIGNFKKGKNMGLAGYITNVSVGTGGGYFSSGLLGNNLGLGVNDVKIPIEYSVEISFNVMHEHVVGWYDGSFADDGRINFPFNSGIAGNSTSGGPGFNGASSPTGASVPNSPGAVTGKAIQSGKTKING